MRGSVRTSMLLTLCVGVLVPAFLWAAAPAWWAQRDVITSNSADDYAVVNQGQVRNIAKQAYAEFKAKLPNGAGTALTLIWDSPSASTDDYRAVNIGQLKNVAKLFYDRLAEVDASIHYPWTDVGGDDYALANIGQVKNVFSFDPWAIAAAAPPPAPDAQAPQLMFVAPAEYMTADHATLNARLTLAEGVTLATLSLNGQSVALHTGDFTEAVTLVAGINTFTLTAVDSAGHSRSAYAKIMRDNAAPLVAITSPANGMTIAASSINIAGTVSDASPLKSVTVNGVPAYLSDGTFEAPAVPLVDGANTIAATAIDILGNTSTASIAITAQVPPVEPGAATPPEPVVLMATPTTGDAPLTVTYSIQVNAPGTIQQVVYDFEGTHQGLQTVTSVAATAHTYTESGDYYPVVTVYTSIGTFTSSGGPTAPVAKRMRIHVAGDDSPLIAWKNMKRSIGAQDIEGAIAQVSSDNSDAYTEMFGSMGPELAQQMVADLGILSVVFIHDDIAQFKAIVQTPMGAVTFYVNFEKENDIWKIRQF